MPKHEGSADVQAMNQLIQDLSDRYNYLVSRGYELDLTNRFLRNEAPRYFQDLNRHPLGDKRKSIDSLLRLTIRCEREIVELENSLFS